MQHEQHHYVNGAWVDPLQPTLIDVDRSLDRGGVHADRRRRPEGRGSRRRRRKGGVSGVRPHHAQGAAGSTARHPVGIQQAASGYRRDAVAGNGRTAEIRAQRQSATGTAHLTRMIEVLETYRSRKSRARR